MKNRLFIITSMCLGLFDSALAVELLLDIRYVENIAGVEQTTGMGQITKLDTDTGAKEKIFETMDFGWQGAFATAPNGRVYFSVLEPIYESGTYLGETRAIWRITPSITPGGRIVYGDAVPVYEVFHHVDGKSTDPRIDRINDLAIRAHPGKKPVNRIYFSVACGACSDGHIYYVDDVADFGPALEYYRVRLEEIPIPSCPHGGQWGGHFAFDDRDNLLISSGNSIPSALYRIANARLDGVDRTSRPELLLERTGPILDMLSAGPDTLYFSASEPNLLRLSGRPLTEDVLFSDGITEYIGEIAEWPSEALSRLPRPRPWRALHRALRLEPDLRVTAISASPSAIGADQPSADIPVIVTIKNFGGTVSKRFKVAFETQHADRDQPFAVPFHVPGQSDRTYGWIESLRAGGEINLVGYVRLTPQDTLKAPTGQAIALTATVDSCLGDAMTPRHCRVRESNEENNELTIELESPAR